MSERKEYLSNRGLIVIGIVALIILVVGIILCYLGLNEEFYSESGQTVFKIITYLGEPVVFIIIATIIYLAYSKSLAKNTVLCLLFSHYLNQIIKSTYQDPRPNTNVGDEYGFAEPSYGFPSGHTQNSLSFWGYISYDFKDRYKYKQVPIVPVFLSCVVFLVGISRMVIGVHDLQDVIGGLLIGIGVLLLFIYLEQIISPQFNKLSFILKIIITLVLSILIFLIGTFLFPNAGLGLVSPPVNYADDGAFAQVGGVLLGFGIGYLLEEEYIKYEPLQLKTTKRIINIAIGIFFLLLAFVPFEYLIKIDSVFFRFFRYALVAFILAYVVPLICAKINK
ncbi:MAG: phosphatase PAP2 family protein [Candidatus Hodarchaeota archaeon]